MNIETRENKIFTLKDAHGNLLIKYETLKESFIISFIKNSFYETNSRWEEFYISIENAKLISEFIQEVLNKIGENHVPSSR